MKLEPRAPAVLRRSLLLAALVVGALMVYAHAAAPASTVHAAARAKAVVGEVAALGGSKRLSVRQASGSLRQFKTGGKLRLGDHVVMGSRVTATLRLTRPKGVSSDAELIDLAPATGTHHDVAVSRKGKRTTVKIAPVG